MELAYKVLGFLITLGVLVIIHELGHYLIARWCGVKILRFSVGFGRILWSRQIGRDQTEWALSAIPLGGYVKMLDEREGDVPVAERARAFNRQNVWKRIAIVGAGPTANLLLAVLLLAITYWVGVPGQRAVISSPPAATAAADAGLREGDLVTAVNGAEVRSWQDLRWRLLKSSGASEVGLNVTHADGSTDQRTLSLRSLVLEDWETNFMPLLGLRTDLGVPIVQEAVPGKPAALAGIRSGDRILAVNNERVRSPADVAAITNANPGKEVRFTIERNGSPLQLSLIPYTDNSTGKEIGIAGLQLTIPPEALAKLRTTVRYDVTEALVEGARRTYELSIFTLKMLGRIVAGDASIKNISGPLTMADFAGQSAQQGWISFFGYLALISISLGVLNLLPIPLLDGGHLLYYIAEIIKGSPVSDRAFEVGQRIGMALLAFLMAVALFNDVSRLF